MNNLFYPPSYTKMSSEARKNNIPAPQYVLGRIWYSLIYILLWLLWLWRSYCCSDYVGSPTACFFFRARWSKRGVSFDCLAASCRYVFNLRTHVGFVRDAAGVAHNVPQWRLGYSSILPAVQWEFLAGEAGRRRLPLSHLFPQEMLENKF